MAKELQDKGQDLAEQAREQALDALGAKDGSHGWSNFGWLLLGAGLGALSAYLLDPDRGRRRQAVVRDQVVRAAQVVGREVPKQIRAVQDQIGGTPPEPDTAPDARADQDSADNADGDAQSPSFEESNNDDGSLTTPTT
jgi:hypothetical protein